MKLPNGESASVDVRKIRDYCLSREHPRGKHKARVFEEALGLTAEDSGALVADLKRIAAHGEAVLGNSDSYGDRYIIDFELTRGEKAAVIRSCWIVLKKETVPRFVTCFVL
jgi:hypothetical protein